MGWGEIFLLHPVFYWPVLVSDYHYFVNFNYQNAFNEIRKHIFFLANTVIWIHQNFHVRQLTEIFALLMTVCFFTKVNPKNHDVLGISSLNMKYILSDFCLNFTNEELPFFTLFTCKAIGITTTKMRLEVCI